MLSINLSEVFWTILCFLALLFFLKHFLFKPIIRVLDERKAELDEGLGLQRQAEETLREDERMLEESRLSRLQESRQFIQAEKERDRAESDEQLRLARESAARLNEEGKTDAQALRDDTLRRLEERRDELAETLAERLLNAGNTEQ